MQAVATEHHANAMAMSNQSTRYGHPLDTALADRNMLSWFGPMFELLGRHWLVALAAGLVTLMLQWVMSKLPWPNPILAPWYVTAFRALLGSSLAAVITVVAYRAIAHREGTRYRVGDVNSPLDAAVRAVQITVVWVIAGLLVELALYLIVRLIISAATSGGPPSQTTIYLAIYFTIYGLPIAIFLLSPIWVLIGVSSSLSQAHAARSLEGGLAAVLNSLRLAFGAKWRVVWPAYLFGAIIALVIFLEIKFKFLPAGLFSPWVLNTLIVVFVAAGIAMTFVIERVYAPELGLEVVPDSGPAPASPPPVAPTPGAPTPVATAPAPGPAAASAAPAAAPAGDGPAIATLIEQELHDNRSSELASLTEQGLAADPRVFAAHPDNTIALAKRLVQAQRPDLALRILQPYVKEQSAHRLHLTGTLLAAELLSREPGQLQATARFLERVKALYPNEPMVDRLIRLTEKAIAQAGSTQPKPPTA
jgi:hypothetical protein